MKKKGSHIQIKTYSILILTFFLSLIKPVDYIFSSKSSLNTAAASIFPILTSSFGAASTGDYNTDSLTIAQNYYRNKKYKKALSLALRLYNNNQLNQREKTKATLIIAQVLKQIGNYDKSIRYYNELIHSPEIDTLDKIKYQITITTLLNRIGKIDSALVYQKQILDNFPNKLEDPKLIKLKAKSLINISALYLRKKELDSSKKYSFIVINNYNEYFDSIQKLVLYNNLATIFIKQQQYSKAKEYLLKSLEYIGKNNALAKRKEKTYWNLALVLYLMKDYRTFEYADKSFDIRDSLNNREVQEAISRIEREFNVERERKKGELRTAIERSKKEKAQLYLALVGVIALTLLIAGWFSYRYIKMQSKAKLERLESENREKILNATIDGKESERKMIAEALHHSVSTLLSSANLHLQALKMQLQHPFPEEIEKTQKIVNEAADEIRSLSHTLISSVLLKFGLSYAIQELVDKHSHKSLQITCSCHHITRYSDEFELRIYHIIAELINNIIKHSKATEANILVKQTSYSFLIKVKDNGKGFKQKKGFTGIGLGQIKTRISQMKGSLEIYSDRNSGTEIIIHIPIDQIQEKSLNHAPS